MNKQAFNSRARVARHIAAIAKRNRDAWVYDQARVWGTCGWVGPDLNQWINWYWGRPQAEGLPESPRLGSLVRAEERGWGA